MEQLRYLNPHFRECGLSPLKIEADIEMAGYLS